MSTYRPLDRSWSLTGQPAGLPAVDVAATVPGCVHTDLLSAGLIDDPYRDDNETRLGWIGRTDWSYQTKFTWTPEAEQRTDLVCEGLDTVASIVVNGVEMGQTANMHRGYRFDITRVLAEGVNTVRVDFASPYRYAEVWRERLGPRPSPYDEPYQFIRKMACNFGWDWGPTLVTSGIWRPIGLHTWSKVRLAQVRPLVTVDGEVGSVEVVIRVERHRHDEPVLVRAEVGGVCAEVTLPPGQDEGRVVLTVPSVRPWWPRGYGEQVLYELTVRAGDDVWTRAIGFRKVELDPGAFRIAVNGRPVLVKGFNWIPDDCFPARVTAERLAQRLGQAVDAGANALRVWGGGVYESDAFYDLADRLGFLVWQDFPFACAAYPEEEPFCREVEAEARENVTRLASHPSLILWCGNNENIEGFQHWGWREQLAGQTWGAGYYFDLLPRVVAELDPTRPYWPGSPYSGSPERDTRDQTSGTVHIWTVWGELDYDRYANYTPRFVAEFGFQGPPAFATLRAAVSDDPLTPSSPGVAHHQKAIDGNAKLLRGLGDHLPRPEGFDDWHYYTQLNQARAVSSGVKRFRALAPYCTGMLVWQLNDCWPVTSWAAVDGDGRRKPLWYELRRAFADRLITFLDGDVALINDTDEPWEGQLQVTRLSVAGQPLAKEAFDIYAGPRQVARQGLPDALARPGDPARELLVVSMGDHRALRMFSEDPIMAYPPATFDSTVTAIDGGIEVHIAARSLLRELAIFPDRLDPDATIDDQLITLLPGESTTLRITSGRRLDPAKLVAYPVLRCVNEAGS